MTAYKYSRRNPQPFLFLLALGGIGLTSWATWRSRQPTHLITQVPEPYRSQIAQGKYPTFTKPGEYELRQTWQRRVSYQSSPSFSHDGRFVLSALGEQLRLYDVKTRRLVREWLLPETSQNPSEYTPISLYTAPGENRWYLWRYARTTDKTKVYTITPEQSTLGEPLPGLNDVRLVSHSGRYLISSNPTLSNAYGPTPVAQPLVYDRQTRKTYPLEIPRSSLLSFHNLISDSRDPVVYGRAYKSSEYLFFSLETGKQLPTPAWMKNSTATLCRFLKDTILTGETDGTIQVRSRENPTLVLKSYPTAIRRFERLGITQNRRFIIAEGYDRVDMSQGSTWVSLALDTTGQRQAQTFLRSLPPHVPSTKGSSATVVALPPPTRTEDSVQLYWSGAYVRSQTRYKDSRFVANTHWIGNLDGDKEVPLSGQIFLGEVAISPDRSTFSWADRRSGDLIIQQMATKMRK